MGAPTNKKLKENCLKTHTMLLFEHWHKKYKSGPLYVLYVIVENFAYTDGADRRDKPRFLPTGTVTAFIDRTFTSYDERLKQTIEPVQQIANEIGEKLNVYHYEKHKYLIPMELLFLLPYEKRKLHLVTYDVAMAELTEFERR